MKCVFLPALRATMLPSVGRVGVVVGVGSCDGGWASRPEALGGVGGGRIRAVGVRSGCKCGRGLDGGGGGLAGKGGVVVGHQGVDVGDVDLAVVVEVAAGPLAGAVVVRHQCVDVGDVHRLVQVQVAHQRVQQLDGVGRGVDGRGGGAVGPADTGVRGGGRG